MNSSLPQKTKNIWKFSEVCSSPQHHTNTNATEIENSRDI